MSQNKNKINYQFLKTQNILWASSKDISNDIKYISNCDMK